jgi:hypothetical protein
LLVALATVMSCLLDLGCDGVIMPRDDEDAAAFVARCAPTSLRASGATALGAVGPSFKQSPGDLVDVAKSWVAAWDGHANMLAFGAMRGLTVGAWHLDGIAHADADRVWAAAVVALTKQQLGSYLAMTAPAPNGTLRVGTADWRDKADVDRVLSSLRAMGYSAPCTYTVRTYTRTADDCVSGHVAVWAAAADAVTAARHGVSLPSSSTAASVSSTPPRQRTAAKQQPSTVKQMAAEEVVSDSAARQARREKNRVKRAARRRAARQRVQQQKKLLLQQLEELQQPKQTPQKQMQHQPKTQVKKGKGKSKSKGRRRSPPRGDGATPQKQQQKQKQKQQQPQPQPLPPQQQQPNLVRQKTRRPLMRLDSGVLSAFGSLALVA